MDGDKEGIFISLIFEKTYKLINTFNGVRGKSLYGCPWAKNIRLVHFAQLCGAGNSLCPHVSVICRALIAAFHSVAMFLNNPQLSVPTKSAVHT